MLECKECKEVNKKFCEIHCINEYKLKNLCLVDDDINNVEDFNCYDDWEEFKEVKNYRNYLYYNNTTILRKFINGISKKYKIFISTIDININYIPIRIIGKYIYISIYKYNYKFIYRINNILKNRGNK
jgi:hypothetical protein